MSLPNWAKVAIGAAVIVAAAAVTVATGGAAAGTVVAAINCVSTGALEGAIVGAATGAVTGAATGAIAHRVKTGGWSGAGQAAIDGAADGFMTGAITGAITGGATSNYCFVAGTSVLTAAGTVAIENIKAGDLVWAWNEETGQAELKPVVETYVNETTELTHVFVDGEEIISTPSHPFYSPVKGWTAACKLRAGDILQTVNGEYIVVEWVQHELLEGTVKVYNFQVEDDHTYYVADSGILVHNMCGVQKHHIMTNKSSKYTPQFRTIASKYDLNLNGSDNIRILTNHLGRHTSNYHNFVLQKVKSFDVVAAGNKEKFMKYFNYLADYIVNHPEIMYR